MDVLQHKKLYPPSILTGSITEELNGATFLRFHPRFSSKSSKNMALGVILAALSCGGIHFAPSPGGEATDAKFGCLRNRISTHRPRACGFRHLTSSKVGALVPMVCLASAHEALLKNASCGC